MWTSPKQTSRTRIVVAVASGPCNGAIDPGSVPRRVLTRPGGGRGHRVCGLRADATPADGAANEAVIKLLAKALGVSRSELSIISGATSRHKRVEIPFDAAEARGRLGK